MSKLHKPALRALLSKADNPILVSVYMPTHSVPTPPNISEDRRRFKNLRSQVKEILKASPEIDSKSSQAIEHRFSDVADDLNFWENRTYGAAIFICPEDITTIELPIDCDEYVAVDYRYHLAPLIGLLNHMVDFSVLIVSKKQPMLFMGDMYGLISSDAPLPIAQSRRLHDQEKQQATVRIPPKGNGRQEYFGPNFPLVSQDDVLHFLRAIDRVVQQYVPKDHPLLLAGPEVDVYEFRSISTHPHILDGYIESDNSATTPHGLAPLAWSFIHKATIQKRHEDQIERFTRLANGKDRASAELAAIQDAAEKGRIETLIIKLIRTTTDTIRNNLVATPKIHFPPDEQMAVIERIARHTWSNHGDITLIEDTATTPPNSALGAIFRY